MNRNNLSNTKIDRLHLKYKMPDLETDKYIFKIAGISLQTMLDRKKSSYLEEKLVQNLKKPIEL